MELRCIRKENFNRTSESLRQKCTGTKYGDTLPVYSWSKQSISHILPVRLISRYVRLRNWILIWFIKQAKPKRPKLRRRLKSVSLATQSPFRVPLWILIDSFSFSFLILLWQEHEIQYINTTFFLMIRKSLNSNNYLC